MTRLTHSSEPVMYIHNKLDLSNVIVFNLIDANKYQISISILSREVNESKSNNTDRYVGL